MIRESMQHASKSARMMHWPQPSDLLMGVTYLSDTIRLMAYHEQIDLDGCNIPSALSALNVAPATQDSMIWCSDPRVSPSPCPRVLLNGLAACSYDISIRSAGGIVS
jgi:hypothetical protein